MKSRLMKHLLLVSTMLQTAACATLSTHVDPEAREAGVKSGARVVLYGLKSNIDGMKIYADDSTEPLTTVMVLNPSFSQSVGNSLAEASAKARASGQAAATGYGNASYTTTTRYSPAVFLDQKGTHKLRLVRADGAEATVVTKSHVGMRYVLIDWFVLGAPTIFTSVAVDWSTGKWNLYDAIQVDQYFPGAVVGSAKQ